MYAYPFSGPGLSGLLGDREVETMFSCAAVLGRMLRFEAALAKALFNEEEISARVFNEIVAALNSLELDIDSLTTASVRDGVHVPELVRQARSALPPDCRDAFHRGTTSQDVIDTALTLTLVEFNRVAVERLHEVKQHLTLLHRKHGDQKVIARTRMQPAGSFLVANRICTWLNSIERLIRESKGAKEQVTVIQFAGPVGVRNALPIGNPDRVAKSLASELGLRDPGASWQTDRSRIANYASWLNSVTGALGKMGMDVCLMAQNGEVHYSGGGKSSALPGKSNPVGAEILVTIARFSSVLISGIHHAVIHEQERSGSSWTLEWMILPQMCLVTAAALRTATKTIRSISRFNNFAK